MMKVDLKGILKSMPMGTCDYFFHKLNTISRGIKENIPGTDRQIWILAHNLRYFWENQPVRRYLAYDENPKEYKLDQTLLPYVKVIRAYARLTDAQKKDFQNGVQHPIVHQTKSSPVQHLNSHQKS